MAMTVLVEVVVVVEALCGTPLVRVVVEVMAVVVGETVGWFRVVDVDVVVVVEAAVQPEATTAVLVWWLMVAAMVVMVVMMSI